jgi:hypothetical protein
VAGAACANTALETKVRVAMASVFLIIWCSNAGFLRMKEWLSCATIGVPGFGLDAQTSAGRENHYFSRFSRYCQKIDF